jgi:hypothetical protein
MTYVAIDPAAVATLASTLEGAASSLDTSRLAVARALSSVGRSSPAPDRLAAVAGAAGAAAGDLRRRLRELAALQVQLRRMGEQGPLYPRPDTTFPTFEAAERAGEDLARDWTEAFEGPAFWDGERVRALVDRLAPHAGDPHFSKAFFAALSPALANVWLSHLSSPPWGRELPYRDDAIAPFLTALSTGLNADPALLRSYLGMLREGLTPGEVRDVLNYGDYADDVVLSLTFAAVERARDGMTGLEPWEHEPGLFDAASRSPELAARLVEALDEDALRDALASSDGILSGFGSVVAAAAPSRETVESLVALLARKDQHLADDVQAGLAYGIGEHVETFGYRAARGLYVGDTSSDDLVRVLVRVMDDNDAAVATLHDAAAEAAARLLRTDLNAGSAEVETLGGVVGLLARADSDAAISEAEARARLYALGSQAIALVPLPGPALPGMVAKKGFSALVGSFAKSERARGASEALDITEDGYQHGRLLLAVSLASREPSLAPPRALLRDDGTLKVYAELDTPAEHDALREWLDRPTPWVVASPAGFVPGTLGEVAGSLEGGYVDAFDALFRRPVK